MSEIEGNVIVKVDRKGRLRAFVDGTPIKGTISIEARDSWVQHTESKPASFLTIVVHGRFVKFEQE